MSASSSPNCDPSPDNEVSRKASLPATVSERYERKCLAITANTPFSQWGEVFVEPAMTLAAVDRLVHHSTILEMNVESYRRRAAQAGMPRLQERLAQQRNQFDSFPASTGQDSCRRAVKTVDIDHSLPTLRRNMALALQ